MMEIQVCSECERPLPDGDFDDQNFMIRHADDAWQPISFGQSWLLLRTLRRNYDQFVSKDLLLAGSGIACENGLHTKINTLRQNLIGTEHRVVTRHCFGYGLFPKEEE